MRAGKLRHRVSIQEQTQTADGLGGFTVVMDRHSRHGQRAGSYNAVDIKGTA